MTPSQSRPDPVDVLADPDPVGAFLRAHERGLPVALRTSGTTARPRHVVRSTGSWVRSFAHVAALAGMDASSRVWVPGPNAGTMNLFARVHATALGARLVPAADGATHTVLTPRALRSLLDEGTPPPPHVTVAGDRCDPVLSRRAREAGADVGHYYGAAELSFVAWGPHAEDLRAFPEVAIEVIDGEVWVDSPFVADRYDDGDLRRRGRQVTAGDRGVLEDGRLRLLGRDDVVVTGGATVRIADVESALGDGVVAVGVPDASWGEVLAAVVPGDADVSMLRERARSALSSAQRPRLWFRMETLPSTAAGKTDRRALAALIASGGVPRIAVVPGARR